MLYVGVDGGGSTCRVRVRDGDGVWRAEARGSAANVTLDFETALATIRATIAEARHAAGAPAAAPVRVALGLAGASSPALAERVQEALADLGAVQVTHDGDIACRGAHAGADGGLIIAGTGSGAVARLQGRTVVVGGRGFLLGDDGSGARLGLEAVREALRAHDGLTSPTGLTRRLMARFDDDPVQVIVWGRQARSSDFAVLAPLVVEAAAEGDAAGRPLVQAAADAIAGLAAALTRLGAPRISFVGGLSGVLLPFLADGLRGSFQPPRFDALDGALLLAGCPLPPPPA